MKTFQELKESLNTERRNLNEDVFGNNGNGNLICVKSGLIEFNMLI